MKSRELKPRASSSFPFRDGQEFRNRYNKIRILKQFGSSWNFLDEDGEEYQPRKTPEQMLRYINLNEIVFIK